MADYAVGQLVQYSVGPGVNALGVPVGTVLEAQILDYSPNPDPNLERQGTGTVIVTVPGTGLFTVGPGNIAGVWDANPTEVVFSPTAQLGKAFESPAGAAAAADAAAGIGDLMPVPLIDVIPGTWAFEELAGGGGYWHRRFANDTMKKFIALPKRPATLKVKVEDIAGAGVMVNTFSAPRTTAATDPAWSLSGSATSDGSGNIQTLTITHPPALPNEPIQMEIRVVSGSLVGGVAPIDQYRLIEMWPEF